MKLPFSLEELSRSEPLYYLLAGQLQLLAMFSDDWIRREHIYFFPNKEIITRNSHCSHCFLYHKAQLNNWVQLLCQVLSSFACTGKTSIPVASPLESHHVSQETCERGLGELDLSSLRRDSFGDLRAGPLPMRRVWQWQSQSPVAAWWGAWEAEVLKQERCRETAGKSFLPQGSRAGCQGYWVLNYYKKIKTE